MLETLWQRLAGGPRGEPEVVDVARLPELAPSVLRSLARELKLVATPAVDPRAFYDAPPLRQLSPVLRTSLANAYSLEADRVCPPYFAQRRDGRDRLFCAVTDLDGPASPSERRSSSAGAPWLRVEVEFTPDGLVGPPGSAFAPEAALDLDQLLRAHDFWSRPALEGPEGGAGSLWHLSVVIGGRHHLLRRVAPRGQDRDLLEGVLAALGIDLAARQAERARARRCGWPGCPAAPVEGDPSRLCAEHRGRVDAQGENLHQRRGR